MSLHFVAGLLDPATCCFLAAEAECEAECERERYNNSGEERLNECYCDSELYERSKKSEDPDSPSCDGTEEVCVSDASCTCRPRYHLREDVSDDDRDEEDK